MTRFTRQTATDMVFEVNVILRADGSARMTRGPADLSRDERSMRLDIKVPRKLFETPSLHAKVEVPQPEGEPTINVDKAAAALKHVLGVDVEVVVVPPSGDDNA